jgi:hypothetical protein
MIVKKDTICFVLILSMEYNVTVCRSYKFVIQIYVQKHV